MPTNPSALPTIPPFPALSDRAAGTYNSKAYTWATEWDTIIAPALETLAETTYGNAVEAAASSTLAVQNTGTAIGYTFDTATADADPGAGKLRLNNATQNTATFIRADNTSAAGSDVAALLATFGTGTSTVKGRLRIQHATDATKWLIFDVTAVASPSGYKNITATCTGFSAASPFANGDALAVSFSTTGDKGDTGATGPAGTFGGTATSTAEFLTGANIASASTVNLDTATGNRVHITGTTTITAWTLTRGPRTVIFDGALQLTYHATTNRLNSNGANVTVEAGDMAYIESDGTTVFVNVVKKNGAAVVGGTPAFGTLGTKQVAASVASTGANAICNLSSTRNFRVRRNASNYLIVDLVDETGAVLGSSSVVESVAVTTGNPCIVPLDSTTAIMSWQTSGNTKAVYVSYSGTTVTIGTVFVVEAVSGGPTSMMAFSATKVAVVYPNSTTNMRYRVLTPGSTITAVAAAGTLLATDVSFLTRAAAMSDTQGLVAFATGTASVTVAPVTEAAGVLTLGTQTTAWSSADPNSGNADVIYTGANSKFVGVFGAGAGGTNYTGWAVVFQISGTGSAAVVYKGPATFIPPSGTGAEFRRLARVSNSVVVSVCSTNGSTENIAAQALQVSGMQASVVAGESLNTLSNGGQIGVCVCGASLLFAYADSTNSNYPTTVALPLGTVGS